MCLPLNLIVIQIFSKNICTLKFLVLSFSLSFVNVDTILAQFSMSVIPVCALSTTIRGNRLKETMGELRQNTTLSTKQTMPLRAVQVEDTIKVYDASTISINGHGKHRYGIIKS